MFELKYGLLHDCFSKCIGTEKEQEEAPWDIGTVTAVINSREFNVANLHCTEKF